MISDEDITGMHKNELDTPALWVDLDAFESNVQRLNEYFRNAGVAWRPHFKGLRVPALAQKQIAAGAIGVTCATLNEAEAAAAAGIPSILIANQVVGPQKIARLIALARKGAEIIVCVDDARNATDLSEAAQLGNLNLDVLVDVDVGLRRCGVLPGEQAVALAQLVHDAPNLAFRGLMGYEGHTELIFDPTERRAPIEEAVGLVIETAANCREAGLPVDIVSCGSSVTYTVTAHIPGVTEIQAGGVAFMDVVYRTLGANMDNALFVQSTVISRPTLTRAVVDAGRKKMGCVYVAPAGESSTLAWTSCPVAMPKPKDLARIRLQALHAEHGILELDPSVNLKIGDRMDFVPGYVDFTVFHFRKLYGIREDKVEAAWDVVAH